jgi:hypothetical protein
MVLRKPVKVSQKLQLPILVVEKLIKYSNKSRKKTDHGDVIGISDFSNGSGTIMELISKYEALEITTSPSKTSTPDLIESEIGISHNRGQKWLNPGATNEISDFSNGFIGRLGMGIHDFLVFWGSKLHGCGL